MVIKDLYNKNPNDFIRNFLFCFSLSFIGVAFLFDSPVGLLNGMERIILSPDHLISDYAEIAGFGTAFLNAGLLMLISTWMLKLSNTKMNGLSIAAIFLMGGFGMFGKNIINIWGIIFGVFLYSKKQKAPFSQYIYIAFFGTSIAPVATELFLWKGDWTFPILFSFFITAIIGFILPPVVNRCIVVHQGYNLYNVAFATGLIATITMSIMNSFGYVPATTLIWYEDYHYGSIIFLYTIFIVFIILGLIIEPKFLDAYKRMLKKSGRLVTDFVSSDGLGPVLCNMGLLGIIYTSYVLLVGGHINGPTMGGVFSIVGFAAFGKHIRNTLPITAGVALSTVFKIWDINEPSVLLSALFGTGLAPIAGQFGWIAGMVTGVIHLSLVLNIGSFHGGMNLYNNGFSAGLVALFLVPLIEAFQSKHPHIRKE